MAQKRGKALNVQPARKKLNELFITWLTLPETQDLVNGIISQCDGKDGAKPSSSLKASRGALPPPLENFMHAENFRGMDLYGQLQPGELSPHQKLKVVDEWDRMKPKVQSPPSSPKPGHPGHPAMHAVHQPAPAPLSPHGHRAHHIPIEAGATSTGQLSPTRMSPTRHHPGVFPLPSPPSERPATSSLIPPFWFPDGIGPQKDELDRELRAITAAFKAGPKAKVVKGAKPALRTFKLPGPGQNPEWTEFVSKALGFPGWWATQIFNRLVKPGGEVTYKIFKEWWDQDMATLFKE